MASTSRARAAARKHDIACPQGSGWLSPASRRLWYRHEVQAPSDFRYEARRGSREAKLVRAVFRAVWGFDPEPSQALVRAFVDAYSEDDPVAEAAIRAELPFGLKAANKRLEQVFAAGITSPTSTRGSGAMGDLIADAMSRPSWLREELVDAGAATFRRYGSAVFRFAGAITLAGYRESSVVKPLAFSGAYVGAKTRDRFLDTADFWIRVSEPDGLEPGAPGFMAALHVRLLHASVRHRLRDRPEWNRDAWGVPISTADALLTLMGGSIAPGLGMRLLGFRTSRREIEAMLHFWRYVGHIMGVRFEPFPETVEDAVRIAYLAWLKSANGAGEDGKVLCRSYDTAFAAAQGAGLRAHWEDAVHRGMTALFLPPGLRRAQGLRPAGVLSLLPLVPFPLVFAAETARRHIPGVDRLVDRAARAERRAWLSRHRPH